MLRVPPRSSWERQSPDWRSALPCGRAGSRLGDGSRRTAARDSSQLGTGPSGSKPLQQSERSPAMRSTNSFRICTSTVAVRKPRIMSTYRKEGMGVGRLRLPTSAARTCNALAKSESTCKVPDCKSPTMNTYTKTGGGGSDYGTQTYPAAVPNRESVRVAQALCLCASAIPQPRRQPQPSLDLGRNELWQWRGKLWRL